MRNSLLEHPRLSEIEAKLNAAHFDEAQKLLAALPDVPSSEAASVYFATRLLFQRGRLDAEGVVERLRELLRTVGPFPEAERLLRAAEQGLLRRAAESKPSVGPDTRRTASVRSHDTSAPSSETPETLPEAIPRAPPLPRFTHNPRVPSYVPAPRSDTKAPTSPPFHRDTELSPPPPPPDPARAKRNRSSGGDRTLTGRPSSARHRPLRGAKLPTIPELDVPRSGSSPTLRAATPSVPVPVETIPSPPPPSSLRSSSTIPTRPVPTLFEIVEALDQGRAEHALELAERLADDPEVLLLRARARAQLGQNDRADAELESLLKTRALDPAQRTGAARVLMEIGFPERALEQARVAFDQDPKDARTRITCAWALLRLFRRSGDERLLAEAEPLLASVRLREKSLIAVLSGLRALMAIERGDPRRALSLAQSALGHNPRQPDALIALAVASARLGLTTDARSATDRLLANSPIEAEAARRLLSREGVELSRSEPPVRASERHLADIWGAAESALVHGRREPAQVALDRGSAECLRTAASAGGTSFAALAAAAAELFTRAEVLRHFAPYDSSIFSVERLAAAFDVLYGPAGHETAASEALIRLASAYVGESVRQAVGGEWHGSAQHPARARVEGIGLDLSPHELVTRRLRHGEPIAVRQPARLHPGADPLGNSVPLSISPPCPWDPAPWPPLARLEELGRVLPDSVVGLYCAPHPEIRLDHSVSSSVGVDRYVALIAPPKVSADPNAGWVRRAAVLVGAYLGEVMVQAAGARWEEKAATNDAEVFQIVLKDGSVATPVARAFDRLTGRRNGPLSEYVTRLVSGRASFRA